MTNMSNLNWLAKLLIAKARAFISVHHENDQGWYDRFCTLFGSAYQVFTDTSLERKLDSTNAEYLTRSIRENNITNSSITVVLCGIETWKRRWIDWEIDMTLRKEHALLGIVLPTQPWNAQNSYYWPDRLLDNLRSDYAHWIYWTEDPNALRAAIATARDKARFASRIKNDRPRMERSKS